MLSGFSSAVTGFLDTMHIAKKKISKSDLDNHSYKQENLVKSLMSKTYEAHNALYDVKSLEELYHLKLQLNSSEMSTFMFGFDYFACSKSLQCLVNKKVLSAAMKQRLAKTSLGLKHLKLAHSRDPHQGIATLFGEKCGSKARVTKSKNIVNKVTAYLSSL